MNSPRRPSQQELVRERAERAALIARAGGLSSALQAGLLPKRADLTLSEALVLGLLQQEVQVFFSVLGHGSTEIGEVLRIYQQAGLLRVFGLRSEIEASHAASALRWVTGEKAAVVTSIGPGALQALAASLVPASDGVGVWYLFGDETTEDEGYNMQQVPRHVQGLYLQLVSVMGDAYSLHTPLALASALRRGQLAVDHPTRPGPFFLLLPMNTQPAWLPDFNLDELPAGAPPAPGAAREGYEQATNWIRSAERVLVKVGGGGRSAGKELQEFLERSGGVLVHTPIASGCIPYNSPRNLAVGGSKGTLCGNFAMEQADLLVAVGTRAVCQSDCSRTGYPAVCQVINLNADLEDALHYGKTLALVGDVRATLARLNRTLGRGVRNEKKSRWLRECKAQKVAWQALKERRFQQPVIWDEYWGEPVLTQPGAIKVATDWARKQEVVCFFDAGDVQANGFQIVEDERPGRTFTETGASYMGFAVSALLATAAASKPFRALALSGDGSFTMNPQILIDGVEHGARGCILLLDNGRMGAISGLQLAQYGAEFATAHRLHVDYLSWGHAVPGLQVLEGGRSPEQLQERLDQAGRYPGLTLIHLPVYYGPEELGGMGVYGRWNVGSWVEETQALRHSIGL